MVEGSKYCAKGALANFLNKLIPICNVFVHNNNIFLLLVIKPMIIYVGSVLENPHFEGRSTHLRLRLVALCNDLVHILLFDSL
jgi:hypothetical protein